MANFIDVISEWVEETEVKMDDILQTILIQIGTMVVRLSPVDTGRFRSNWHLTIESESGASTLGYDRDGQSTINLIASAANSFTAGQVAYIQNNVLYGDDLEYGLYNGPTAKVTSEGYSTQAPNGMVRVTEAEFMNIVNNAIQLHQ